MSLTNTFWAMFIAFAYVLWPNVGKHVGVHGSVVAIVIVLIAIIVIGITSHMHVAAIATLTSKQWGWLLAAGVLNGLAIYVYSEKAASSAVATGLFLVTVFLLQAAIAPIIDWALTGTELTRRQWGGLGTALLAIFLLTKS